MYKECLYIQRTKLNLSEIIKYIPIQKEKNSYEQICVPHNFINFFFPNVLFIKAVRQISGLNSNYNTIFFLFL